MLCPDHETGPTSYRVRRMCLANANALQIKMVKQNFFDARHAFENNQLSGDLYLGEGFRGRLGEYGTRQEQLVQCEAFGQCGSL
jgi:hypothetical protein